MSNSRLVRFPCAALVAFVALPTPLLAAPADPSVNAPLCTAPAAQDQPAGTLDRAGRAVFVWRDARAGVPNVSAQRLAPGQVPVWAEALLDPGAGECSRPRVVPAGDGVIVIWQEALDDSGDVVAQRLEPALGAAVWPALAVVAAGPGTQRAPLAVPDLAEGAIVAWTDTRSGVAEVYAQRLDASGSTRWTAGGVGLRTGPGTGTLVALVPDGAGGALVTWADSRGGYWAQRVDSLGAPAWSGDGVPLCQPGPPQGLVAVSDGAGGLVAAYEKADATGFFRDLYAQRLRGDGLRAWPDTGVVLSRARYFQRAPAIAPDGAGGAIVAWDDSRSFHFAEVFAQRVDSAGAVRWTSDGVLLRAANGTRPWPAIVADGAGGAIVGWQDDRGGAIDVWAQRVDADGHAAWPLDGVPVSTAPDTQSAIVALADGGGGATFAWVDGRGGVVGSPDLWTQHVWPDGSLDSLATTAAPSGGPVNRTSLAPPVPNPARGRVRVAWTLPAVAVADVRVVDPQGRLVRVLRSGTCAEGRHAVEWDLRDASGAPVPAGLCFVILHAGSEVRVQRLVTVR